MPPVKLTYARKDLLWRLDAVKIGRFIYGAEVRTAKSMPEYVTVEDNGYLPGNNERWFARITDAGRAAIKPGK